jgi:hypothetical protein
MRAESGPQDDGTLATITPTSAVPSQSHGGLPLARAAATQSEEVPQEAGIYSRQRGSVGRFGAAVNKHFRLPTPDDPTPSTPWLLLITGWAAALGLVGLLPAAQVAVMVLFNTKGPSWYPTTTVIIGVIGLALVAAGFASIHRNRLPLAMLTAASALLIANVTLIYTVL